MSGAQEIDTYLQVIERAWEESHRAAPVVIEGTSSGEVCDDSCAVDGSGADR